MSRDIFALLVLAETFRDQPYTPSAAAWGRFEVSTNAEDGIAALEECRGLLRESSADTPAVRAALQTLIAEKNAAKGMMP